MSAITHLGLKTSTLLGASAGLSFTALGLLQILAPETVIPLFNIPVDDTGRLLIPLCGARELAVGASILSLIYARSYREAGAVVSASMIFVVVDMFQCWGKWDLGT